MAAGVLTNAAIETFGVPTSNWGVITHAGIMTDDLAANNSFDGATAVDPATDVITLAASHGLLVNDPVMFSLGVGATIPVGITVGQRYYVKSVSVNNITLSTTVGGATLNITADGSGTIYVRRGELLFWGALTTSKTVNNGDAAPKYNVGDISVTLD